MTDAPPRTAIVTGGARGIGAAIAARLAADGMAVGVLDLDEAGANNTAALIADRGGRALGVRADVADEDSVVSAVETVASDLGLPVVIVNNAGVTQDNLLFKMTASDWDTVMNVHLRGAFLVSRAAQKYMVDARFGRIVNISSTSALGNRGQANYSAAKAGLHGFTKTLAVELGKFGITANSVAPGFVETEMTRITAERMGISFEEYATRYLEKIPVGRVGQPEDIAHVVSFLVSEGAGYVSGQVIYAAGGPRSLPSRRRSPRSDLVPERSHGFQEVRLVYGPLLRPEFYRGGGRGRVGVSRRRPQGLLGAPDQLGGARRGPAGQLHRGGEHFVVRYAAPGQATERCFRAGQRVPA
jgi:3-oxoacyl-[acyl-carrier protein] reductase